MFNDNDDECYEVGKIADADNHVDWTYDDNDGAYIT